MTLSELPNSRISGKYLKARQQEEKHIKKNYQKWFSRTQDQGEYDCIMFKKPEVWARITKPAKARLWGQQFQREMLNINAKATNWAYTASVTQWTKLLQITGKEKQARREGDPKEPSVLLGERREVVKGAAPTCSHVSSPVDVGNTRHTHNAIVHQHQDKKMNGIPWRQQREYLDNFYVTWKGWQFRTREYFPCKWHRRDVISGYQ